MGRRNRINKKKKETVVEEVKDLVRDNTNYSVQPEQKKSKFFGIFSETKDKIVQDFSEKLEKQKREEEDRLKRIEELKEKAKKDAEEKAKQLQKEKEKKLEEAKKQKEEEEKKLKEEAKKAEEKSKEIKKGTFASLLSNIKILDNFKEDVSDTSVMMREIIVSKKEKVKKTLNLKIIEDNKVYTLKFDKKIMCAYILLTNLDESENIELKLFKHRYQDTANYLTYNTQKIKVNRNNTIIKFKKNNDIISITGNSRSFNIKLKNKNIDCIKIKDISSKDYIWI